ncbi:MAG: aminopeptidase [Raineya sp.]|jgi:predicted aminopeptidase|nr:aminopeptidase [Raineya sp.]
MKKKLKKIAWGVLFVLLILAAWYHELLIYGINQGIGQAKIIWNARPITEVLEDKNVPDSIKNKLRLIQEIKRFAEDSLGINPTKNYTTFYDQKKKPLLWVVTACPPYELKAHEWTFGFLGKFSYKGHFDMQKALKDSTELANQGYDTDIGEVRAWSTLGWFKDPILSSMLRASEGDLANLIIHELTHSTLYVKDDVDFNENLASFIGDKGALLFLERKFGKESKQYKNYIFENHDDSLFYEYVLKNTQTLKKLYESEEFKKMPDNEKKVKKEETIASIVSGLAEQPFKKIRYNKTRLAKFKPNNTFFMGYVRYRAKQTNFEEEFQQKFKGNLKNYLNFLKEKYPSL